mmetsp:Transcript_2783/g.9322  ORF Transcript_2783/g.9322 Transcript_2783/m.9322 type:complete len:512 (-) Transcript_2783:253-1788(-)
MNDIYRTIPVTLLKINTIDARQQNSVAALKLASAFDWRLVVRFFNNFGGFRDGRLLNNSRRRFHDRFGNDYIRHGNDDIRHGGFDCQRRRSSLELLAVEGLGEDHCLADPSGRRGFVLQTSLFKELNQVRHRVVLVVRLVVERREAIEGELERAFHAILLAVANLHAIHKEQFTAGLQHARHFLCHSLADRTREFVEQVHVGDHIKLFISQRHVFGVRLDEAQATALAIEARIVLTRRLQVMRGQFQRRRLQFRVVVAHKRQESTSARRHVQVLRRACVTVAHEIRDVRQRAAAHGVGGSQKQRLHLEVIQLRALRAQPSIGLVVKVLQVVIRITLRVRHVRLTKFLSLLFLAAFGDDFLVALVRARQRRHSQRIPLRRRRRARVHIIRKLVHAILHELQFALEYIDNSPHVLFEKLAHFLRLLLAHVSTIHRLTHNRRRRARRTLIRVQHHARNCAGNCTNVYITLIIRARRQHALRQEECKSQPNRRRIRRSHRRRLRLRGQQPIDALA